MEGDDFEIVESPTVIFDSRQLGRISLTWWNTRVRLFLPSYYNHVRYRPADKTYAFIPTTEIREELYENDFPTDYRPVVDDITRGWYLGQVAMIFNEINDILGDE